MNRRIWFLCLLTAILLLCGCNMRTVDQLYAVPKRSDDYQNLRAVIEKSMADCEYSAPLSGDNLQSVQMTDLDGDGKNEYLLFAKSTDVRPLRIFIFTEKEDGFVLLDTIESSGAAFDRVVYAAMDAKGGTEIVVGRQISDDVVRSLSVYTLVDGQIEQLLSTNYTVFLCNDLDTDNLKELLVLRPGESATDNGVAELYGIENNNDIRKAAAANMSAPADSIKRVMVNQLNDGIPAVYVASEVNGTAMVTDVYAVLFKKLVNITFSNDHDTSINTLRNYYVYADDIDSDGVLELPQLVEMTMPEGTKRSDNQYLIRWYAMTSDADVIDKQYTYHNYVGGWYLALNGSFFNRITVIQQGNTFEFRIWDEDYTKTEKLLTLYVLTGQNREDQATVGNRFVLHRTETTVYAADLEVSAATYDLSQHSLITSFELILEDWYTGDT